MMIRYISFLDGNVDIYENETQVQRWIQEIE